jgi:predicted phage tail protein
MSKYEDKMAARGAGGGGGKSGGGAGRAPIEAPDSLRSRQYARVLDLLCEGEIKGLVDGLKSVYLDDTPIQNPDGSYNFNGVTFLMRNGTQNQSYIPGFDAIESEQAVGTEVTNSSPVTRSITNTNVNAVRVTLSIPQLTLQNTTTGDLNGSSVEIAIDVQNNGGGFVAQNLRKIFTSANFAIVTSMQARGYVESSQYQIAVAWAGQQVYAPQSLTMKLQYRAVGNVTWVDYETFTFNGGSFNSTNSAFNNISNGLNTYPSGSRTFSVTLPTDEYEFQLVKVTGSIQNPPISSAFGYIQQSPSVGTAYGGTVSISSGTIYQPVASDVISGKTTKRYQRDYRLELPGDGPWDIRVRRITADSVQTVLQNKTYWDSYTEIIDTKLTYPNSVVAGLQVSAEQFQAVPSRGFLIDGQLVRIPSNYDPILRTYDGTWDGTFVIDWTNNPAWCFFDLLTAERYGLGSYIDEEQVDKWSLYSIAQYCDEMVEDGYGGIEPRFTLNMYIQAREEAFTVINNMASIFRAMAFWSAGSITAVQDAPSDPVALFTCANVIDGSFNYSGSSGKARHTVVLVAWNDPVDNYRQKIEYVEDTDGIARYGIIQSEVYALGCTSRGQAHRYGRAIIFTEQMESETVSFGCGLDGTVCYPGAVIQIQDQFRAGTRMGGRVISADTLNVTIDASVTLESGKEYTLSCVLPDGTIEDRIISNPAGTYTDLGVTEAFSDAPQDMAIWMVTTPTLQATSWRIISVAETQKARLEITALAYRPDKYAAIEEGLVLEPLQYSNIGANPDPVSGLEVIETLTLVALGVVGVKATVSWNASNTAVSYLVRYQRQNQNILELAAATNSIDISPLDEGIYTVSVIAVNAIGRRSQPTSIDVTILGKTAPPADVQNLQLAAIGGTAHITFTPSPDLDVIVGGSMRIKHSPDTEFADWASAVDIGLSIPGDASNAVLPLVAGTYLAKWVDSSNNLSENAVSIVTTAPSIINFNAVETVTEDPAWTGTMNDVMYDPDLDGIKLVSSELWDSAELMDEDEFIDAGAVIGSGEYISDTTIDLGSVMTSRLTASLLAQAFSVSEFVDSDEDWDSLDAVDLITGSSGLAQIYVRTTNDDTGGSPVWSSWQPFFVGDYTARGYQFMVALTSGSIEDNVLVNGMSVTIDMPDRIETGNDVVSGAGTKTVTYNVPFYSVKGRGVTAENLQQGDYYEITNESTAGFDITFRNLSGVAVSRTFDYTTVGYGNG